MSALVYLLLGVFLGFAAAVIVALLLALGTDDRTAERPHECECGDPDDY
ncbi:hypothetical protein JL108_14355 [Aeromicrobium sp. YIM 150415]|nr:hypothetical protein [Aeromicrobium sp. YIM 150415]MBM9464635.1 hypothetical protein [Aeromicrobium sp. YIM 150415]